jgi:hypothetical protein
VTCDAKIRPFPGTYELVCELDEHGPDELHVGVVRDYAYPGSETVIRWDDGDRRTYRGDWPGACGPGCMLPSGHHGRHAP